MSRLGSISQLCDWPYWEWHVIEWPEKMTGFGLPLVSFNQVEQIWKQVSFANSKSEILLKNVHPKLTIRWKWTLKLWNSLVCAPPSDFHTRWKQGRIRPMKMNATSVYIWRKELFEQKISYWMRVSFEVTHLLLASPGPQTWQENKCSKIMINEDGCYNSANIE